MKKSDFGTSQLRKKQGGPRSLSLALNSEDQADAFEKLRDELQKRGGYVNTRVGDAAVLRAGLIALAEKLGLLDD